MFDWKLFFILALILVISLSLVIYPLRKHKKLLIIIAPIFVVFSMANYWLWGGVQLREEYRHKQMQVKQAEEFMKHLKTPTALARKLKMNLKDDSQSAKGWFLLGRLYASTGEWQEAEKAFATAYKWNKNDENTSVNYAQSIWQNHQNQPLPDNIRELLEEILAKNSVQPDSLSLLAMDAYVKKNYAKAIEYWQRLMSLVSENSAEQDAIRKAILMAQQQHNL